MVSFDAFRPRIPVVKKRRTQIAEYLQIKNNRRIILPAVICRVANLQEGDTIKAIVEEDGSIRLIPEHMEERKLMELFELEDINWAMNQKKAQ